MHYKLTIFFFSKQLSLKSDDIQSTTIRGSRLQLRQQSSWSSLHDPKQCRECQYDLVRQEYTNKRYDPFMSRSSYRTFDYYGRRNGECEKKCLYNFYSNNNFDTIR